MLDSMALALALSATPAQASPTTVVLGRVINDALPDRSYDWTLNWSAFGSRLHRDVFWSLSEPGADEQNDFPEGLYRRSGWISEDDATASLAVCGDQDQVRALTIAVGTFQIEAPEQLIFELQGHGVIAREVSRTAASLPEGRIDDHYRSLVLRAPQRFVWSLSKPGHGSATLTADHICSPPGTANATNCWFRFTIDFRGADEAPTPCPLGMRYGI